MRALVLPGPGRPPQFDDRPVPDVRPDQVLVRVAASSLNPSDWKLAFGAFPAHPEQAYPITLGRDFAGVVETVGSDVRSYRPGDEVCGMVPDLPLVHGSLAEFAPVVAGPTLARKPKNVDFEAAATLGVAGTVAVAVVDAVEPSPGTTVLLVGAAGGVGAFALQLLVAAGATVIASGYDYDADYLRRLGATHVLRREDDWEGQVRATWPEGIDALVDLTSGSEAFVRRLDLVAQGGCASSPLHPDAVSDTAHRRNIRVRAANGGGDGALDRLVDMVDAGSLRLPVATVCCFDDALAGLERLRHEHTRGKHAVQVAS